MRWVLLFLLIFLLNGHVVGQELKLLCIEEAKLDSLLSTAPKDLNGKSTAIVVLQFQNPINNVSFKGNIIEQLVLNGNTYVLYVADITKRITIQHEDYYPFVLDFRNNNIRIEGGHSYRVFLENKKKEASIASKQELGSQYLVFRSETIVKRLKVDDENWETENWYGLVARKMVPFGIYHYKAESEDGKKIKGEVKVNSKLSSKVVHLNFEQK